MPTSPPTTRGRGAMRHPSAADAPHDALPGYLAFYRARWAEGQFATCHDDALKRSARRCLAPDGCSWAGAARWDVRGIARTCARLEGEPGGGVFGRLGKAFEFLELLCVNLFVCPWRKEIRSLKVSGGFAPPRRVAWDPVGSPPLAVRSSTLLWSAWTGKRGHSDRGAVHVASCWGGAFKSSQHGLNAPPPLYPHTNPVS